MAFRFPRRDCRFPEPAREAQPRLEHQEEDNGGEHDKCGIVSQALRLPLPDTTGPRGTVAMLGGMFGGMVWGMVEGIPSLSFNIGTQIRLRMALDIGLFG